MARLEEENNEQPQYSVTSEAPSDAHLPPQNYEPTDQEQQYHHQQATAPPNESVAYPPPQYAQTPPPQYAQTAGMMPPPHLQPGMMPPPHPQPWIMPPPHPQPGKMPPPHFIPTPQPATEGWRTDLFGCFDDPTNALITLCCPCVTFGQIAEILDNGQTSCATSGVLYSLILFCIAMPCLITCSYRTKLRSRYNLVETPAPDWLTHCFCEPCALCQAYRELNLRGMDPSIGWQGNLQRQQQAAMMVPPMQPGMMHR